MCNLPNLRTSQQNSWQPVSILGENFVPAVDPVVAQNGEAGREDHKKNHNDAEQNERTGPKRKILKISSCQCSRHGWWLRPVLLTAAQSCSSPPSWWPRPTGPAKKWRIHQVFKRGLLVSLFFVQNTKMYSLLTITMTQTEWSSQYVEAKISFGSNNWIHETMS